MGNDISTENSERSECGVWVEDGEAVGCGRRKRGTDIVARADRDVLPSATALWHEWNQQPLAKRRKGFVAEIHGVLQMQGYPEHAVQELDNQPLKATHSSIRKSVSNTVKQQVPFGMVNFSPHQMFPPQEAKSASRRTAISPLDHLHNTDSSTALSAAVTPEMHADADTQSPRSTVFSSMPRGSGLLSGNTLKPSSGLWVASPADVGNRQDDALAVDMQRMDLFSSSTSLPPFLHPSQISDWVKLKVTLSGMNEGKWTPERKDLFMGAIATMADVPMHHITIFSVREKGGKRLLDLDLEVCFQVKSYSENHAARIKYLFYTEVIGDILKEQAEMNVRVDRAQPRSSFGGQQFSTTSSQDGNSNAYRNGYSIHKSYKDFLKRTQEIFPDSHMLL